VSSAWVFRKVSDFHTSACVSDFILFSFSFSFSFCPFIERVIMQETNRSGSAWKGGSVDFGVLLPTSLSLSFSKKKIGHTYVYVWWK